MVKIIKPKAVSGRPKRERNKGGGFSKDSQWNFSAFFPSKVDPRAIEAHQEAVTSISAAFWSILAILFVPFKWIGALLVQLGLAEPLLLVLQWLAAVLPFLLRAIAAAPQVVAGPWRHWQESRAQAEAARRATAVAEAEREREAELARLKAAAAAARGAAAAAGQAGGRKLLGKKPAAGVVQRRRSLAQDSRSDDSSDAASSAGDADSTHMAEVLGLPAEVVAAAAGSGRPANLAAGPRGRQAPATAQQGGERQQEEKNGGGGDVRVATADLQKAAGLQRLMEQLERDAQPSPPGSPGWEQWPEEEGQQPAAAAAAGPLIEVGGGAASSPPGSFAAGQLPWAGLEDLSAAAGSSEGGSSEGEWEAAPQRASRKPPAQRDSQQAEEAGGSEAGEQGTAGWDERPQKRMPNKPGEQQQQQESQQRSPGKPGAVGAPQAASGLMGPSPLQKQQQEQQRGGREYRPLPQQHRQRGQPGQQAAQQHRPPQQQPERGGGRHAGSSASPAAQPVPGMRHSGSGQELAGSAFAAAAATANGGIGAVEALFREALADAPADLQGHLNFAAALRSPLGQPPGLESLPLGALEQQGGGAVDTGVLRISGLSNEAGEYNCFLNAIIQCLWHCDDFRRQVGAWPPFLREYNPVLRAVHSVFAALEWEEADRSGHNGDSRQSVVSPNMLREALSSLPGQLFKAGEMNDAGEVLLTIYDQINSGVTAAIAFGLALGINLGAVFGLPVHEYVYCGRCGLSTHDNRYTQYYYNTQATAIREMRRAYDQPGRPTSLGQLLKMVDEQTLKSCDTDKGGCNTRLPVVHALERAPRVFTLQLAWESQAEEAADIAATLAAVGETLDLQQVYRGLPPGQPRLYRLRSLVCYYGAHYFAFVLLPELQAWAMIDDTRLTRVGSWTEVRMRCERGRVQPSMLFFEAQS